MSYKSYKDLWNPVTQSWDIEAARKIMQEPPDFAYVGIDFATLRDDIGDDMLDATAYCFEDTIQTLKEKPMKTSKWTPVEIETFLQIYYRTDMNYFEMPPSKQTSITSLHQQELIREANTRSGDSGYYLLTQKGRAFLQLLLNTPTPKRQARWVDPRTDEVLIEEE